MAPHAEATTESELTLNGIIHNIEQTALSSTRDHTLEAFTNGHASGTITNGTSKPTLADLDASKLITTINKHPKPVPAPSSPEVVSQKTCTDHMLTCVWTSTHGWSAPHLQPYGPLSLMPTASCLHYATECFEGMKLYRDYDGALRLFRPQLNCARMLVSAARIALPTFNEHSLLKLIAALCALDGPKWLPRDRPGDFLYIRPTLIASDPALGVQRPKEATLFVILSVFPHLDVKPLGMRLLASQEDTVRAWPGGFGHAKVGANYGPTLCAQGEARARGFDQVLWLFGSGVVTEAGASNFFVVWRNDEGRVELVTAPLCEKIILDGVTRRSVLQLARERLTGEGEGSGVDAVEVVERTYSIEEVARASREGRLLEAFVCGTAFFVCGVSEIGWKGESIKLPVGSDGCGQYARLIKSWLKGIMYGKEKHEWGYVVEEKGVTES
jgi:branched-chain amino acid aminotransferase